MAAYYENVHSHANNTSVCKLQANLVNNSYIKYNTEILQGVIYCAYLPLLSFLFFSLQSLLLFLDFSFFLFFLLAFLNKQMKIGPIIKLIVSYCYYSSMTHWAFVVNVQCSRLYQETQVRAWKKLEFQLPRLDKQLSNFACPGQVLLSLHFLKKLANDMHVLAHWASEIEKLLAQQANLLVLKDQTVLFSSPASANSVCCIEDSLSP